MAQTGYTPISIYYSSTATNVPTAGNLVAGELAINTADGKLFYKDSAGVVQVIGTKGGVGSSSTTQVLYNSSGLVVGSANMTFNGTTLTLANDASINSLVVGKGYGSLSQNTVFGVSALSSASLTGNYNTAVGYQAGYSNTTGAHNSFIGRLAGYSNTADNGTAIGSLAMQSNTTGASNTAIGFVSLNNNTTGSNNVAVGRDSLAANTTASNNTAVGYQAGYSNTTGAALVAVGQGAAYANTTGVGNTAIGQGTLLANQTGQYNTAVGQQALYTNTGNGNTAVGVYVLYANTTGISNTAIGSFDGSAQPAMRYNTTGSYNVALGTAALSANTTASNNTAIGYQSLQANTTGTNNVSVGYNSLYTKTTGSYNVAVGIQAGFNMTTGQRNTLIGTTAGSNLTTGSYNTFIGSLDSTGGNAAGAAITTGSNNTILGNYTGNQGGLDIRTLSNYIVLSDGDGNPRYYFDAASGDWFLNQVTAGYYCLMRYKNQAGAYFAVGTQSGASPNFQIYNPSGGGVYLGYSASSWTGVSDERLKNITGEISDGLNKVNQLRAVEFTWKRDETNESQVGLIAQDVQAVLPQAIGENDGYLGVRYTEVIPLLVAAIKELKAEVDSLKQQLGK